MSPDGPTDGSGAQGTREPAVRGAPTIPSADRLNDRLADLVDGPHWLRAALPLLAGFATSFSQAPASLWPLALLGPGLALALGLAAATPARAALIGWAFGVGYFLPGLLWIGEAFLVEADKFAWMRPFAVTLLPMGLSLFWAAAFWVARRLAGPRRAETQADPLIGRLRALLAMAAAAGALWALAELARSYVLTGFPWGLFAFAFIETPAAQATAWIGPHGLNAAVLVTAACLAVSLRLAASGARTLSARTLGPAGAGLALMAAVALAGGTRLPTAPLAPGDAMMRLVQPNVPQREKWVREFRERNLERLFRLTQAHTPDALSYVVWPETATPYLVDETPQFRTDVAAILPPGARLVLGSQRVERRPGAGLRDFAGARFFNSLMLLAPDGTLEAVYDKHHLVPFGEFLPFQDTLQSLGINQLAGRSTGFSPGPGPLVIRPEGAPSFAPLICYEAIFPHEMPPAGTRPDVLMQITNDAWFGESSGPWQHLVQARFRAIEQGLPLVRSANTGITASIDPYGRIDRAIGLGEMGAIDVRPAAPLPATVYARAGDWPAVLALMGLVVAGAGVARSFRPPAPVDARA